MRRRLRPRPGPAERAVKLKASGAVCPRTGRCSVPVPRSRLAPQPCSQPRRSRYLLSRLVTFNTAGHGIYIDERDKFNHELLTFAS